MQCVTVCKCASGAFCLCADLYTEVSNKEKISAYFLKKIVEAKAELAELEKYNTTLRDEVDKLKRRREDLEEQMAQRQKRRQEALE